MDENNQVPATDSPAPSAPAEETQSTPTSPAESTPAESPTPSPKPEPTAPDPQTTDPNMPDHGVNPDKGIDPDAGDQSGEDSNTAGEPNTQDANDVSKMTRAERAEYFRGIQQQQRRTIEQAIDKVYQPQPLDDLKQQFLSQTDDYGNAVYTDAEATLLARDEARSQREQINEARAEIAELNMSLSTEAMDVVNSIPWTNGNNKDTYDGPSTEIASGLYEALAISKDPRTGQIIEAKMTPKEFYSAIDKIRSSGSKEAGMKAQKAAESQLAAVAPPSSTTNKRETPFDSLSASDMRAQLLAKGVNVT